MNGGENQQATTCLVCTYIFIIVYILIMSLFLLSVLGMLVLIFYRNTADLTGQAYLINAYFRLNFIPTIIDLHFPYLLWTEECGKLNQYAPTTSRKKARKEEGIANDS